MKHQPIFLERCRAFKEWNAKNPALWRAFDSFSSHALQKGRRKLSAWLVINRIRWEYRVETTGVDFKIKNDYIALYARKWMSLSPAVRGGFFSIKRMRGEDFEATCRQCGVAVSEAGGGEWEEGEG